MIDFIFNGVHSADFGVIVENPPTIPAAQYRVETQQVMGSSKLLHFIEGPTAMEPVSLSLDCAILSPDDGRLTALAAWLRGGGLLVIPGDEGHAWRAWVKNQIDLEKVLRVRGDRRFVVEFECEGIRYIYPEAAEFDIAVPDQVMDNPGTAPAEPVFTVYGTGDVSLMVGESTLLIDALTDYAVIDCEAQIVYREGENLGASVTRLGDWPAIPADGCVINWDGDVTRVSIRPRWRDF